MEVASQGRAETLIPASLRTSVVSRARIMSAVFRKEVYSTQSGGDEEEDLRPVASQPYSFP